MDRRLFLRRFAGTTAVAPDAYPPLQPPSVAAGLEPYTGPWTARQAAHLIRRTHFGLSRADLGQALASTPGQIVDLYVDTARARTLPGAPSWYNQTTSNGSTNIEWIYEWQHSWYAEMRAGGLREKMALLWHDHFSTQYPVYEHAAFAYQYLTFLREHSLGNFRDLLEGIGQQPAMLRFLNGVDNWYDNSTNTPHYNENYARELLELFSLGILGPDGSPNYSQADIVEAAKALTGWVVDENPPRGRYDPSRHDNGNKTIFGQTGNWGYDDVIDIIFQQRESEMAHFVAGKLYSWFVYPAPNTQVVADLAQVLLGNSFDIAEAVRVLLKSAHFYEEAFIGARIKFPSELLVGFTREMEIIPTQASLERFRVDGFLLGQDVFNPPSVAGWPGFSPDQYRAWITTGTLPSRRGFSRRFIEGSSDQDPIDARQLVENYSDPTSAEAIVSDFTAHFLANPLPQETVDELLDVLLNGAPVYEWYTLYQTTPSTAEARLKDFFIALCDLPEFQLT
ncbi:MAG: DUF1800 domain-containing protein [Rhodothermaceae bacterium]|nr:DUF1800 domain-containing protein [Rhodothermaceae bacterium]